MDIKHDVVYDILLSKGYNPSIEKGKNDDLSISYYQKYLENIPVKDADLVEYDGSSCLMVFESDSFSNRVELINLRSKEPPLIEYEGASSEAAKKVYLSLLRKMIRINRV